MVLVALLFITNSSQAAFVVKKHAATITTAAAATTNEATLSAVSAADEKAATTETAVHQVKKKSFFGRLFHSIAAKSSAIPQILYVILAIIGLGWVAMGVNDSFSGSDWLISLLLYILFYFPGLIYTLIKMNKYY